MTGCRTYPLSKHVYKNEYVCMHTCMHVSMYVCVCSSVRSFFTSHPLVVHELLVSYTARWPSHCSTYIIFHAYGKYPPQRIYNGIENFAGAGYMYIYLVADLSIYSHYDLRRLPRLSGDS